MPVLHLHSPQEFQAQVLQAPKGKLVIVDFTAAWCGPCKVIAPVFEKLSSEYPAVSFFKLDVDEVQVVSQLAGVTAMPTFQLYRDGAKVDETKGANPNALEAIIKKHASSTGSTAATGSGSGSGSGASDTNGNDYGIVGYIDIGALVDKKQLECLNQQDEHGVRNAFESGATYLESDCDEQLLLTVPFQQPIKLHSIKFIAKDIKTAPKSVKLYANRSHIGFDETDSVEATQHVTLTEKDYDPKTVTPLRFVKFQNLNHLAIFVENNLGGGEVTQIQQIVLIGSATEQTKDLSGLKVDGKAMG